jgi:hypothetical protein
MSLRAWMLAVLVAAWPRAASGQVPRGVPAVLDTRVAFARIEAARRNVRSIEADFDEERSMGLHAAGHLVVLAPDKVRWEMTAPARSVFVVDGPRVAYRAGATPAGRSQLGPLDALQGDVANFLGGALAPLTARYRISASGGDGFAVVLTIVPTDPAVARVLARMTLVFAPDLRSVVRIVLEDHGGDRATIALHGVRVNSGRVSRAQFAAP